MSAPIRWLSLALCCGALLGPLTAAAPAKYASVRIEPVKTSIYIGSVTLATPGLTFRDGAYAGSYTAKVFPFFFASEEGRLAINVTDEQFRQLEQGQPVDFTGLGHNTDGDERRVEGRATPTDAKSGRIKVRIFVSRKIELIFNTTYRFEGGTAASGARVEK